MRTLIALMICGFVAATSAHADENYYGCTNIDPASKAPASVLVLATSAGMMGLMNGLSVNPPRAAFSASTTYGTTVVLPPGQTALTFGKVNWEGNHTGFDDFQSAVAFFNASDALARVDFFYQGVWATYANCQVDSSDR